MEKDFFLDTISNRYPLTIEEVRKLLVRVSLNDNPTDKQLLKHGFYRVYKSPKPTMGVSVEGKPRFSEGRYYQTWNVVEASTYDELKEELLCKLRVDHKRKMKKGYPLNDGTHIPIDDSKEKLTDILLEAFLLKEDNVSESYTIETTEGQIVKLSLVEVVTFFRKALTYRRKLSKEYKDKIAAINKRNTYDDLKELEVSLF